MTQPPLHTPSPLHIQTPCTKRWEELVGGDTQRYCSQCSLHVHNAAELTREQALELVATAPGRVCMRIELSALGEPLYRASEGSPKHATQVRRSIATRAARWAVSAAAGVLAACTRTSTPPPTATPTLVPCTTNSTDVLGVVASIELLGDVAVPLDGSVLMGEVSIPPPVVDETPPPAPPPTGH